MNLSHVTCRWMEILQRHHGVDGVQLGLASHLIHVRVPQWKTQPRLFLTLGLVWGS